MAYCRFYKKRPDNLLTTVICSGVDLWPPCKYYNECMGYARGEIKKPPMIWGLKRDTIMEKYHVEATLEVIVSTCVELTELDAEKLDENITQKKRKLEALLRDRIHIDSYEGNGGTNKLIGVVGHENSIRYDSKYTPKLISMRKIV